MDDVVREAKTLWLGIRRRFSDPSLRDLQDDLESAAIERVLRDRNTFAHLQGGERDAAIQRTLTSGALDEAPRAHRAISNLKVWMLGTHRGVSKEHLAVYLDEYVFRHNRRCIPMTAFETLLGLGALHEPTTYDEIARHDQAAASADWYAQREEKTGVRTPVRFEKTMSRFGKSLLEAPSRVRAGWRRASIALTSLRSVLPVWSGPWA